MIEIIVNTNSKNSVKKLSELEKIFKEKKIVYKVHRTSKTITAKDLMDEVSSEELIVIGGDGTINEVVNNYHGEKIIYLAKGSGNDLARSLALKSENIMDLIKSNKINIYDIASVNGENFCSGLDIGFNADIIKREKQTKLKKYLKKYIYIYCGILSLLSLKKYYVKAEYDKGKLESSNIYLFNIMIQPYEGGGIKFSDTANGQDGLLHVMVMSDMKFRTFVYNYICLLLKQQQKMKGVKYIKTKNIKIKTDQKHYQIDGELKKAKGILDIKCVEKFYKIKRK